MRQKVVAIALVLAAVLVGGGDKHTHAQEVGAFCNDYPNFPDYWSAQYADAANSYPQYLRSVGRVSDKSQFIVFGRRIVPAISPPMSVSDVAFLLTMESENLNPVTITARFYVGDVLRGSQTFNFSPVGGTHSGGGTYAQVDARMAVSSHQADTVWFEVTQPTNRGTEYGPGMGIWIKRICGASAFPTATNTPRPTAAATRTPAPTNTQAPTYTPYIAPTPTHWTPYPTSTSHPTQTAAAASTATALAGANATQVLYATETSQFHATETAVRPLTGTPIIPTLGAQLRETPAPPDGECSDFTQPCPLFEIPVFPTLGLHSPTPILLRETLTPMPSITLYSEAAGSFSTVEAPLLVTSVAMLSDLSADPNMTVNDASGDPVTIRSAAHETGAAIGTLFGYARMLQSTDLGRVGTVLSFLFLLLAINILIRIFLFIVPILFNILRFILDIAHAVIAAINAVIPF